MSATSYLNTTSPIFTPSSLLVSAVMHNPEGTSMAPFSASPTWNSSPTSSSFSSAVDAAVWWWGDFLKKYASLSPELIKKFENSLREELATKITNHWYPDMPLKGQGYRSLSLDRKAHLDPVLHRSAISVGIENLSSYFAKIDSVLMWIDPHEVVVKICYSGFTNLSEEKVLYRSVISTPPKLSLKTYPQRSVMDVKSGANSGLSSSPSRSVGLLRSVNTNNTNSGASSGHLPVRPPSPPPSFVGSFPRPSGLSAAASQYIPTIHYAHPSSQFSSLHKTPFLSTQQQRTQSSATLMYNSPFSQSPQHQYVTWHNGHISDNWNDPPSVQQPQPQQNGSNQRSKIFVNDYWESGLPLEAQA